MPPMGMQPQMPVYGYPVQNDVPAYPYGGFQYNQPPQYGGMVGGGGFNYQMYPPPAANADESVANTSTN